MGRRNTTPESWHRGSETVQGAIPQPVLQSVLLQTQHCWLQGRQEGLNDAAFAVLHPRTLPSAPAGSQEPTDAPILTWAVEAAGCRYSLGLTAAVAAMLSLGLRGSSREMEE